MKYAAFLTLLVLGLAGALAYFLTDPLLFVVALILLPPTIQAMPWGIDKMNAQNDKEEAEPYQGTAAGFHAGKDSDESL